MDNANHSQHDPGAPAPLPEGAFDADAIALAYVEALRELAHRQDAALEQIERLAEDIFSRPVVYGRHSEADRLWIFAHEVRRIAAAARKG